MNNQLFGYDPQDTWLHHLGGATKLLAFIGLSVIAMASYDTRFTIVVMILTLILFKQAKITWRQISLVVKVIFAFSVLNLITVYIFAPEYGVHIYGTRHLLLGNHGYFTLTQEQLFYEFNLALKYIVTVPLALIFLITTNPSEFAASLNRVGVSYRISYAIALALRYIPDVQANYLQISLAQQARGYELSKKAKLATRLKGATQVLMPLIFSSLERIDTISQAMELRRFGRNKKRTWYMDHKLGKADYGTLLVVAGIIVIGIGLFKVNGGRFFNPFK
ncbi:energy-coupling factor transporter transmembrane component T family protein [Periweissella ghanensis]|uniref:Energy-coupling factor transporter transmembrane protein EcfT n=1 Tax=Periweissella ghanensis TaxID=467997 RepID=A0ABM8ZE24_9LACO|nr:energy-coupling factor transporter transmembrane component T [Periweissella ghanensis]MCM0601397.1 energy-coupling factor transporter transmembrane protein EcfT [Periweissella ghanensis]CAH0419441.1 Energy-coupling factor transporter transmembrane protein EcfT [Periweissella ghanensis]